MSFFKLPLSLKLLDIRELDTAIQGTLVSSRSFSIMSQPNGMLKESKVSNLTTCDYTSGLRDGRCLEGRSKERMAMAPTHSKLQPWS